MLDVAKRFVFGIAGADNRYNWRGGHWVYAEGANGPEDLLTGLCQQCKLL